MAHVLMSITTGSKAALSHHTLELPLFIQHSAHRHFSTHAIYQMSNRTNRSQSSTTLAVQRPAFDAEGFLSRWTAQRASSTEPNDSTDEWDSNQGENRTGAPHLELDSDVLPDLVKDTLHAAYSEYLTEYQIAADILEEVMCAYMTRIISSEFTRRRTVQPSDSVNAPMTMTDAVRTIWPRANNVRDFLRVAIPSGTFRCAQHLESVKEFEKTWRVHVAGLDAHMMRRASGSGDGETWNEHDTFRRASGVW